MNAMARINQKCDERRLINMTYPFEFFTVRQKVRCFKSHFGTASTANIVAANATHIAPFLPAAKHTREGMAHQLEDNFITAIKAMIIFLRQQEM